MRFTTINPNKNAKIYVAGHRGMVGGAIVRELHANGYENLVTCTRDELDLTSQSQVSDFFQKERPQQVYLAAAKVGGIYANNTFPADFIYQNLMIEANVIHSAWSAGVRKLLFLGSSCIYPKFASQPIKEKELLTGALESTNEPYALAKIAGIKLCESYNRQYGESFGVDYRSLMPTNLYGPGDNYHSENSHVIPGLIRRFHEAKAKSAESVTIWGSGKPRREFLYVDDLAKASIHVMNLSKDAIESHTNPMASHINVGYGNDITIMELAQMVANVIGYVGNIICDTSKNDGAPRKLMDSSMLNHLGWVPSVDLKDGLQFAYQDFIATAHATRSQ